MKISFSGSAAAFLKGMLEAKPPLPSTNPKLHPWAIASLGTDGNAGLCWGRIYSSIDSSSLRASKSRHSLAWGFSQAGGGRSLPSRSLEHWWALSKGSSLPRVTQTTAGLDECQSRQTLAGFSTGALPLLLFIFHFTCSHVT